MKRRSTVKDSGKPSGQGASLFQLCSGKRRCIVINVMLMLFLMLSAFRCEPDYADRDMRIAWKLDNQSSVEFRFVGKVDMSGSEVREQLQVTKEGDILIYCNYQYCDEFDSLGGKLFDGFVYDVIQLIDEDGNVVYEESRKSATPFFYKEENWSKEQTICEGLKSYDTLEELWDLRLIVTDDMLKAYKDSALRGVASVAVVVR